MSPLVDLILIAFHDNCNTAIANRELEETILGYVDSDYKDKRVLRPSYLYNGNPYTGWGGSLMLRQPPIASFTKEVDLRLAEHPLVFIGGLANRVLTSLVKEATGLKELTGHVKGVHDDRHFKINHHNIMTVI